MGACAVYGMKDSADVYRAFQEVRNEAVWEKGNDPYSGTFATCAFCGISWEMDGMYKEENFREAQEYCFDAVNRIGKREAYAVDMGIDHYELIETKIVPVKEEKTSDKYIITDKDEGKPIKSFEKLKDAKEFAYNYTQEYGKFLYIFKKSAAKQKMYCSYVSVKKLKSEPEEIKDGAVLREIHKYYFYGKAAE